MTKAILCSWCGDNSGYKITDKSGVKVPASWHTWCISKDRAIVMRFFCSENHLDRWRDEKTAFCSRYEGGPFNPEMTK